MSGCDYVKQLRYLDSEWFCHVKALRSSAWRNMWANAIDQIAIIVWNMYVKLIIGM